MKRFAKNIADRKELVNWLKDLTGLEAVYTRMPRCAYEIGAFTVEKDGVLTCADGADEDVIQMLKEEGMIGEELTDGDADDANGVDLNETGFVSLEDDDPMVADTQDAEAEPDTGSETEVDAEALTKAAADADAGEDTADLDDPIGDAEYEQEAEEEAAASLGIRDGVEATDAYPDMEQENAEPDNAESEDAASEDVLSEEDAEPEGTAPDTDADPGTEAEDDGEMGDMPTELAISLPMRAHTGESLRRLINLIYSQGPLLTKATGGSFHVSKALIEAMDAAGTPISAEDFRTQLAEYTAEHGGLDGLALEDERVTFTGFPMTEDGDRMGVFRALAAAMNRQAVEQKRIQAKTIVTESEKYTFRNWLVRIGMGTAEFKTARAVLLENLGGHTAFRNKAEEAKWKARQKEKRDAAKAAAITDEHLSETPEDENDAEAPIQTPEAENGEA